ncbi:DNA helicase, Rad3 [Corynebacterium mustelae]|uniref:ATP-dependent helicase DinG n=1 Tax=Corynebacterium mustelae TaxID=571915 RepID=A0A0G3H4R0_9CORY|nr:ATP-dependent DNA helicase [Corynebacterium mustelae]AKK06813.1 DNA helicase, Rad3 [Corynebacterium mustelae]
MSTELACTTEEVLTAAVDSIGGATRDGQVAMAQAVTRALETQRHLAVQAGTGTGKSLAYLVPAIRYAQLTDSTVIVSTATIALQRQLVERDLPRLADALEPILENRPTFAIMKGRHNYLCQNKVAHAESLANEEDALLDESEISWLGAQIARLYDWANETETGDRDSLEPGVSDLAWRQVSVSSKECIGASRCPHGDTCFAELARRQAKDVDIVVTNHAMLAIDAMLDINVLPEHDVVIIDEAHELDGRITSVSTMEISTTALTLTARRAGKLGAEGRDEKLKEVATQWEQSMLGVEPGRLVALPEQLGPTLTALRDCLWQLKQTIGQAPAGEAAHQPEQHAERLSLANHIEDQHDCVVRILEVFAQPDESQHSDVVWAVVDERRGTMLKVAPLSVAGLLHDRLFGSNTVVLTSATLTIGGNFAAMAASWGLPKGSWDHLDAGTPFDPAKSGILYTPRHIPEPGRDGLPQEMVDEIYDLIMAAGGRTLGLFSSRRAAMQATELLRPRLPFDILCQGDDTTGALVDRFAKQENTCLFGTLTLWQGVDVPGKSCSLVFMDRIPFPRPDDPLLQARKEAADAAGRNGFMEVAATHAALLMAQGAGRLLRHVTDRGVVAVLDKRIVEKRYGGFLLNSMPRFWRTTDKAVVTAALGRLVTG